MTRLTSGYFAGEEPLRIASGERLHKQQSPLLLLLRIILSSSKPGDFIFDPFSGTGTTSIVSLQLNRNSIGIEKDNVYYEYILARIKNFRSVDRIDKFKNDYRYTKDIENIWGFSKFIENYQPDQSSIFDIIYTK